MGLISVHYSPLTTGKHPGDSVHYVTSRSKPMRQYSATSTLGAVYVIWKRLGDIWIRSWFTGRDKASAAHEACHECSRAGSQGLFFGENLTERTDASKSATSNEAFVDTFSNVAFHDQSAGSRY